MDFTGPVWGQISQTYGVSGICGLHYVLAMSLGSNFSKYLKKLLKGFLENWILVKKVPFLLSDICLTSVRQAGRVSDCMPEWSDGQILVYIYHAHNLQH